MNFEDLNCHFLKHGGGLGKLGSLLEPAELIHGDSRVSARHRLDLVSINLHELIVKIVGNAAAPLLVGVTTYCYGSYGSVFRYVVSGAVGVFVFPSDTLGIGFPVLRGAITAHHEELPKETSGR